MIDFFRSKWKRLLAYVSKSIKNKAKSSEIKEADIKVDINFLRLRGKCLEPEVCKSFWRSLKYLGVPEIFRVRIWSVKNAFLGSRFRGR